MATGGVLPSRSGGFGRTRQVRLPQESVAVGAERSASPPRRSLPLKSLRVRMKIHSKRETLQNFTTLTYDSLGNRRLILITPTTSDSAPSLWTHPRGEGGGGVLSTTSVS